MRAAVRPFVLVILIYSPTVPVQAQVAQPPQPVPMGGVNELSFVAGSPMPTTGGVSVSVTQQATAGFTCTKITIRVVDNTTGMTLDSYVVNNPGSSVVKSFTGLGSNRQVQVTVDAIFQSTTSIDAKHIEAIVTTL